METRTFTDPDGVEVFTRHWPIDEPRSVVVIAHGVSEHSGRYGRFAEALNAAGHAAAALDQRGHGETGRSTGVGRPGPRGGDGMIEDVRLLVEHVAGQYPGVPVVLFGHSGGSMVAQAYVGRHGDGLAGYVLSACPGVMEGAGELLAGLDGAVEGGMADEPLDMLSGYNAAFEPARTPYDWLSRDEAEVDAYVADPRCGDGNPVTYGFMRELVALAVPAVEPDALAALPDVPVLLITGEADPVTGAGANVRALEDRLRDAGRDVTARYYPEARHELLNETNRDEVTADVVEWLDGLAR